MADYNNIDDIRMQKKVEYNRRYRLKRKAKLEQNVISETVNARSQNITDNKVNIYILSCDRMTGSCICLS